MNNNKDNVKSLNDLLQGEYMAVNALNIYIPNIEEENTKNALQDIQNTHRKNIQVLSTHIQNLGASPHENVGIKGTMSDVMLKVEMGIKGNTDQIIEKMINSTTAGINMAEKVMRGNLDDKSRKLAGEILQNDRHNIDKLNNLLN